MTPPSSAPAPRFWRPAALIVAVALSVAACSNDPAPRTTATTTTAPPVEKGPAVPPAVTVVPPAPTDPVDPEDAAPIRADLDALADQLPYPEPVIDCLTGRAATDDDLRADVAAADPEDMATYTPILDAGAACTHTVIAAPRFAQEQQRAQDGTLTDDQLTCLRDGYAALTPEQVEAATGAALNPDAATDDASASVQEIVDHCTQ